ncbi:MULTISPECIES: AtzE family amidohydrolase [Sphingomonadales]|uniref:Biuret hydrolase n=1 Tax=Edaphosphingomonas haloaromaticamans TaxID=653954 RepID=A0A1S1HB72_9SPHN|nr:AtzE family amidohydrolase [Sphingomonas haloaromaticamans]OHT18681.1 Biuret hydrolase [Sphingomonas haloaromaticamans]
MSARSIIAKIRSAGTASSWARDALCHIEADRHLNCFTAVLETRATEMAARIDAEPHRFPLAGLPFAAKDLFDVAGRPTLAGSRINLDHPPARRDATAIGRLTDAGANLVGLTNMDEYAYGFSTENAHYGPTRNPHDPTRIAGGSSGGSAAAVAAGIVPAALGSDTNGSIRVPASLCGIYGLKATYGRLSRGGSFPFVADLDHIGPLARDLNLLAVVYDHLQGPDPLDPACAERPCDLVAPLLERSLPDLQVGVLEGWFRQGASDEALAAVDHVASAFPQIRKVVLEGTEAARSAAFCLTGMAGGSLHANRLKNRAMDFDPAVRDRLLAGLMLPANLTFQARRVRRKFMREAVDLFREVDVLLAPATPCTAPRIGESTVMIAGREIPVRANLGLYTQPISFIGLPVIAAPVRLPGLPIGVQIIGPPWGEVKIFQAAAILERSGRVGTTALPSRGEAST